MIRTGEGTAFTGKDFRQMCKNLHKKLLYGTPYFHTATGLVERGIKTIKDPVRTYLEGNCNPNETLHRSLMGTRKTVQSKIKETPFERHYGRKPRTKVTSYQLISYSRTQLVTNSRTFSLRRKNKTKINLKVNTKQNHKKRLLGQKIR